MSWDPSNYRGFPRYLGPDPEFPAKEWSTDTSWFDQAACRGMSPSTFFPERGDMASIALAKQTCARCPAQAICLAENMDETYGVFGGTTPLDRQRLRGAR